MRHFFRINVHGAGYSLHSYSPGRDVEQLPLDVPSPSLPPGFLPAQRRIDDLLERRPQRVGVAVSAGSGGDALAVWGCHFPLPDEHGRLGLTFVHGIVGDRRQALDLMSRVIAMVSPDNLQRIGELVGRIATGAAELGELLPRLDRSGGFHPLPEEHAESRPPAFGSIVHDCGGAPFAWLAMVRRHGTPGGPWEVHDTLLPDGRIATVAPGSRLPRVLLSDLLREAVHSPAPVIPPSPPAVTAPEPAVRPARAVPWALVAAVAACLALVAFAISWTAGDTDTRTVLATNLLDSKLSLTADPVILQNRTVYLVYRRGDGRVYPQARCAAQDVTVTCTPAHTPPRGTYEAVLVFVDKPNTRTFDAYLEQDPFPPGGLDELPGVAAAELAVSAL
jgi:hypothetical protein